MLLSFAQLKTTLASHLKVDELKLDKFQMRLKQLQRLGWPRGVNNGRKTRVSYTAQQLLELAFIFELIELGLSPERATGLIEFWWDSLRDAFLRARDEPFPVVLAFLRGDFSGLLAEKDRIMPIAEAIAIIGIDPEDRTDELRTSLTLLATSRASLINVSAVLSGLTTGMKKAGVESAFVWAQTEIWREELQDKNVSRRKN